DAAKERYDSCERSQPCAVPAVGLVVLLFGAPVDEVAGVEGDAKKIGGDESELGGAEADDAYDGAVNGGHDPALPEFLANKDGSGHGQDAGQIIETNQVEST